MINEAFNGTITPDLKIKGHLENIENKKKYWGKTCILEKMLWPDTDEIEDYMKALHDLSIDSDKVSKKVTKCYLEKLSRRYHMARGGPRKQEDFVRVQKTVSSIGNFLKIDDKLIDKRLEWVLGFPEVAF